MDSRTCRVNTALDSLFGSVSFRGIDMSAKIHAKSKKKINQNSNLTTESGATVSKCLVTIFKSVGQFNLFIAIKTYMRQSRDTNNAKYTKITQNASVT